MPFDGVIEVASTGEDQVFPSLRAAGSRLWIRAQLQRWRRRRAPVVALSPGLHYAAVALLLEEAKALVQDEAQWLQGAYRWFGGRYCAVGALCAAAGRFEVRVARTAHAMLLRIARRRRFTSVESMNDRSCHAAVVQAFDEAVALAWAYQRRHEGKSRGTAADCRERVAERRGGGRWRIRGWQLG